MAENSVHHASTPPRLMSSSISSLSSSLSLSSSKQISQVYKQSSELFLTRRLQEALSVVEPIITPPLSQDNQEDGLAPIATASSNLKKKVWTLYISILNAIVELGAEEGIKRFGKNEWKTLASKARDGELWNIVSQVGYGGRDGCIDADVVYNIATLLLTHAPSQKLNQQRLEHYISSSSQPNLDVAAHVENSPPPRKRKYGASHANGTDTPKDLSARVRILELFTLHVLPRNDEWDYAKEFISLSEILDDERKDAFLQTLENLREERKQGELHAAELQREKEAEFERQRQEAAKKKLPTGKKTATEKSRIAKVTNVHRRMGSEVDYGIENELPNAGTPSGKSRNLKPARKAVKAASASATEASKQSNQAMGRMRMFASLLVALLRNMRRYMSANPLSFLRALLIVFGVLIALRRADVRNRLRRTMHSGWQKIRGTVGMGVKVSYI
ncbi:peroxin 26 [Histoplasma capsulatum]|uniref:Peroxin 26 n=2 Tax=Histoplasma TaxID=5036 RepID=A0A8A1M686_AJECA|nr:peroxin 26 [Histoplasma capsulatum]